MEPVCAAGSRGDSVPWTLDVTVSADVPTTYANTGLDQWLSQETPSQTLKFLWDGQNIQQEYDDLGATQGNPSRSRTATLSASVGTQRCRTLP